MMDDINMVLWYLVRGVDVLVGMAGLVGAVIAGMTRPDAYSAADRMSKWAWVAMLAGSTVVVVTAMPMLNWIGMVIIGIYWFDVYPQIKSILGNSYGW